MDEKLESILRERHTKQGDDYFYQRMRVDGSEHYLEVRFRNGVRTCFRWEELSWFNYDPERGIDMEFSGNAVTIEGRGLIPDLFQALKEKKVSWVQESSSDMQDSPHFPLYIREITITPGDIGGEEEAAEK